MRNEWKKSKRLLGGYPCVETKWLMEKGGEPELNIAGLRGEIWEIRPGCYRAIIKPGLHQNNVFRLLDVCSAVSLSQEALVEFTQEKLESMLKLLKVPKRLSVMVKYANSF